MDNTFKTVLEEEMNRLEQIKREHPLQSDQEAFRFADYAHRLSRSSMRYYVLYRRKTSLYARIFEKIFKIPRYI